MKAVQTRRGENFKREVEVALQLLWPMVLPEMVNTETVGDLIEANSCSIVEICLFLGLTSYEVLTSSGKCTKETPLIVCEHADDGLRNCSDNVHCSDWIMWAWALLRK